MFEIVKLGELRTREKNQESYERESALLRRPPGSLRRKSQKESMSHTTGMRCVCFLYYREPSRTFEGYCRT